MPTHELGQRVDHHIRAMLNGPPQAGRGNRVVHEQRNAVAVTDSSQLFNIDDIARRVTHGFAEDQLGPVIDPGLEGIRVVSADKPDLNALFREGMGKEVKGAPIKLGGGDNVVPGLGNGLDRGGDRRHARCHGQRTHAAFQQPDTLLKERIGRIHDPAVDVALNLQIEEVGAMLSAVKGVRGCLVDRRCDRFRRGVRLEAAVNGQGIGFHDVSSESSCCDFCQ